MKRRFAASAAALFLSCAIPVTAGAPGGSSVLVRSTMEAGGGISGSENQSLYSSLCQPAVEHSAPSGNGEHELRSGFLAGVPRRIVVTDVWAIR